MKFIFTFVLLLAGFMGFSQLNQVPVYTATSAQSAQPGEEAIKAIDNDPTTIYHSRYDLSGIPDELTFYFSASVHNIKKAIYIPRPSGTDGIWSDVSVYYSTQNNPNDFILLNNHLNWNVNNSSKEVEWSNPIQNPFAIKFVVSAAMGDFSSCAEMQFYATTPAVIDDGGIDCVIPTGGLVANHANDIKATIFANGSSASSFQPGENIEKSFDGDLTTLYHSNWSNTSFPVLLNYRLDGNTPIDYLKYIPRSDGGINGNFGQVIIKYNTPTNANYQTLMGFDFGQSGVPTIVHFPYQITPLNVRLEVQDGTGNFASCAEMGFYEENSPFDINPPANIFADEIFSLLLPNVTQSQIDTINSPFFKTLAQCLFDSTYNRHYRVQSYEVYQPTSYVSNELKLDTYDDYENATGILFESGEKIALFVKNIPVGVTVQLNVKDFESSYNGPSSFYELQNGWNVFELTNGGLGYINYYNIDTTLSPVVINIVSGKINGYFDNASNNNEPWIDLMARSTYPKVDLKDQYVHLVFDRDALKAGSPWEGNSLLTKYNEIVEQERLLMGLFKYNRSPKNKMIAYSEYGGGYWAGGGFGVHLDLTWGIDALTRPGHLDMWGVPHEFGHINQIYPDLLWIGTSEVTNNIYSIWVDYKLNNEGVAYTRLESESISPKPGMATISGGRINGAVYNTLIAQKPLQDTVDYDVFKILVPFWQLELYYQLAGAAKNAPTLSLAPTPPSYTGVDYAHWFGTVAEMARNNNNYNLSNGEYVLNFVKNTCDAVEEDLTDFFIKTGFLRPINVMIEDYGMGQLEITQAQIDATIQEIQNKHYPQPVSPVINYISANSLPAFKNQLPLEGVTGQGVNLNAEYLTVQPSVWKNVVAYETKDAQGNLLFVSIAGTGDPAGLTTKVYFPANAYAVYAVGFDGQRKLVYPEGATSIHQVSEANWAVYPNPLGGNEELRINLTDASGQFTAQLSDVEGKILPRTQGNLKAIEKEVNQTLKKVKSGSYFLKMVDANNQIFQTKIIKR